MKKTISTILTLALLAMVLPFAANAKTSGKHRSKKNYDSRTYEKQDKNIYEKHRNVFNIAIGAGAGALLGALFGGKKGALIGAGVGAGSAAVYTYKINPKNKKKNNWRKKFRQRN